MSKADIYGIAINKLGKVEKNQKVKEGRCQFPFKYKKEVHDKCVPTEKGEICATSVSERGTLKTYGYCYTPKMGPKPTKATKSITIKKLKGTKTSPKKQTMKKEKANASVATKSEKVAVEGEVKPVTTKAVLKPPFNDAFIEMLGQLQDFMKKKGEFMRSRAYQKAEQAVLTYPEPITEVAQMKGVPGIGKTILAKMEELVTTGKLNAIEKERANPIHVLTDVYGIGPKKAQQLIDKGITSLNALRQNEGELNTNQRIGLKYYDDLLKRIPRKEIDAYKKVFQRVFSGLGYPEASMDIVGSYRRGVTTSGDIDVILTDAANNQKLLEDFLTTLEKEGIILHKLSDGKKKVMVIAELPGKTPRRVDFLYAPPSEYAFAVLYFTGSKVFNTMMRQRALDLGFTLNEHGIYHLRNGKKAEKVDLKFGSEADIFRFLKMKYKDPVERKGANAVVYTDGEPEPASVDVSVKPVPAKPKVVKAAPAKPVPAKAVPAKPVPAKPKVVKAAPAAVQDTQSDTANDLKEFKKKGGSFLDTLTPKQIEDMYELSNHLYFNEPEKVILTDAEFDVLTEYIKEKYPTMKALKKVGAVVKKNKIKLPFPMPSLDKIKPDTGVLPKWLAKYNKPPRYEVSAKLDGVSGMYMLDAKGGKLYTRGDGDVGQDVTHLIPYLKLPTSLPSGMEQLVIRGEFIMKKSVFAKEFKPKGFKNVRNLVAGLVNKQTAVPADLQHLDFVAYEVMVPPGSPSEQFATLEKIGVLVVRHMLVDALSNTLLSDLLVDWRVNYEYDIDGIVVYHDKLYSARANKNPEHAFAFKMVLSDQKAEARVVDVVWKASKDGYLKPVVKLMPVELGGVRIENVTGNNAAFIEKNKIGVGAIISLVRSGDVIPKIIGVVEPADEPKMPSVPYVWNKTHVDIELKDKQGNTEVIARNILGFFKELSVDGIGPGIVNVLVEAGYTSVPAVLKMSKADFLALPSFKEKKASKIHDNIQNAVKEASLPQLMSASNIFGRGFGTKRMKLILAAIPDLFTAKGETGLEKRLESVSGVGGTTAKAFMKGLPVFKKFMADCGLSGKLRGVPTAVLAEKKKAVTDHLLSGKKIVMTGFRDADLIKAIEAVGGEMGSSVSKKTFVVLVKDKDETSGKADKARELGIPIMTADEFKTKYKV